jgi:methyl coenzyme M reductase subunit C-like uncharacterized protein (methanogenesis marker protein 7)
MLSFFFPLDPGDHRAGVCRRAAAARRHSLVWKQYKSPEAKRLERRLRALSAADDHSNPTKLVKERVLSDMPRMQRMLQSMPRAHQLDRVIVQSGLEWTVPACCSASGYCSSWVR